jgi:hypothetical protein
VNVCGRCKDERVTQDTLFLCSLIYPEASPTSSREEQKTSFAQVKFSPCFLGADISRNNQLDCFQ